MSEEPSSRSPSHPQGSPSEPSPLHNVATAHSLAGKRVVVCEDEGITQMQLRRLLTRAGMVVAAVAGDGEAAVEAVLREQPDLVLMDIRMPVMDGLEAAKQIMAASRVCIVMLTAYVIEEYRSRAEEIGACGYVVKPVTSVTLIPQLQQAYSRFTGRAE